MDSNNCVNKIGVGEREGWVFSDLLMKRYYALHHGIGWSGELLAMQPKAVGSSVLQKVVHRLAKNFFKFIGFGHIGSLLILPVCTGMSLTLCMMNLRLKKPNAKFVIFLWID